MSYILAIIGLAAMYLAFRHLNRASPDGPRPTNRVPTDKGREPPEVL